MRTLRTLGSGLLAAIPLTLLLLAPGRCQSQGAAKAALEGAAKNKPGTPPSGASGPAWASQLPSLRLPERFTLTYHVVDRDVSTPETRNRILDGLRRSYQQMADSGSITQEKADEQYRSLVPFFSQSQPTTEYEVALSARDGRLLFHREDPGQGAVLLYDGQRTSLYQEVTHAAEIRPGYHNTQAGPFPLPAVGLPYIRIVRNVSALKWDKDGTLIVWGEVPLLDRSARGDVLYGPGRLRVKKDSQGSPRVLRLVDYLGTGVTSEWDYLDYGKLDGVWIARRMRWRQYRGGSPAEEYDFALTSGTDLPMSAASFSLESWLKKGTSVVDYANRSSAVYDPEAGTLDQQLQSHSRPGGSAPEQERPRGSEEPRR